MPQISIIIPVLNESGNIVPLYNEIKKYCPTDFELIWVDDGSTDDTLEEVFLLANQDKRVKCLSLSKNFGHQNALMAGIHYASGEFIITMDGDLQHPPSLIPDLLNALKDDYDIVLTIREKTKNISLLKRMGSTLFYRLINFLSDTKMEPSSADFRAFNNKVLEAIKQIEERELFLRGIFNWVGFKKTYLTYNAPDRAAGVTKYSFQKMLKLGLRGTTSFSFKPLRLSLFIGIIVSLFAFAFALFALISYFRGATVTGWTSLIIAVMFLGGVQLLVIGLLGEYVAGMFMEIKKRPLYLIKEKINL